MIALIVIFLYKTSDSSLFFFCFAFRFPTDSVGQSYLFKSSNSYMSVHYISCDKFVVLSCANFPSNCDRKVVY
ncbi:hypothetical protein HMPREF3226_00296 [Prevotella corporis]|uniref:Uncharacterized protein n=1 Tax=Prevotella corporis TaxID=28128 RepID=A0A133QLV6_9BACT|nr:hypothetical protein HMPREF3226_00296 [Prevotella corporis]